MEGTRKRGRGATGMGTFVSAWKVFILGGLILLLWLAGVLWLIHQIAVGMTPYVYWRETTVNTVVFAAVGAVVATRRPANPIGWLFITVGLLFGAQLLLGEYAVATLAVGPEDLPYGLTAAWFSYVLQSIASFLLFFVLMLFPTGRLLSPRWRIVAWAGICVLSVAIASDALKPGPLEPSSPFDNPFGVDAAILGQIRAVIIWPLLAAVFGALLSLMVRLHRSRGEDRQQIKWFVAVAVLGISSLVSVSVVSSLLPEGNNLGVFVNFLGNLLWIIVLASLPIAVGIAILKHRLYDIDIIINRTLVYGTLTVCVVGIYVLVVGYLGAVFQTRGNLAVSIFATGLVAIMFQPLRERLQRAVNRLMYGERDEPYAVLSRLGERLEATLAPEAALPVVARTVREALKLPYTAIALGEGEESTVAAESGDSVNNPLRLPLVYQGETVGQLLLVPRAGEQSFSPADQRLLDSLAHQAGAAVHAVRLTSDLQRSRERLVTAREEERRRLRRDLHDGLGPVLGSLPLRLDVVEELMERDPTAARELLRGLKSQAKSAVTDIRRLVYELRPPALDDLGLSGALREAAAQHGANGARVSIQAPEMLPPLPAAVEVAAYRIAQEALNNAARHAAARECLVRLIIEDETLRLEIEDDGRGIGERRGQGVGLHSMRERAAELGGACVVEPGPAGGTRVRAWLPVPDASGTREDLIADA